MQRCGLIDPGDVSGLRKAIERGSVNPREIVAVIGKTHGNGLVNDYTRGYLMMSLSQLIGGHTGESAQTVCERVPFIFSGGVEGVLSPHYAVFTVSPDGGKADDQSLAVGVAFTPPLLPEDVGRQRQIDLTAAAVADAMSRARIARGRRSFRPGEGGCGHARRYCRGRRTRTVLRDGPFRHADGG